MTVSGSIPVQIDGPAAATACTTATTTATTATAYTNERHFHPERCIPAR